MVITCISLVNRSPWYELLPFECHTALSHGTDNSTCILWVQLRNKRNYINCIQQSNRENRQLQCASKVTSSPISSIVTRQINCTITQRLVALIWYASIMVLFTVRIYRFLAYIKVYHIDVIDDMNCRFFLNVCQCISRDFYTYVCEAEAKIILWMHVYIWSLKCQTDLVRMKMSFMQMEYVKRLLSYF